MVTECTKAEKILEDTRANSIITFGLKVKGIPSLSNLNWFEINDVKLRLRFQIYFIFYQYLHLHIVHHRSIISSLQIYFFTGMFILGLVFGWGTSSLLSSDDKFFFEEPDNFFGVPACVSWFALICIVRYLLPLNVFPQIEQVFALSE